MEQVEESVDKVQGFIQSGMLQAAIVAVVILVVTAILSYAIVRLIKRLLSSDGVPLPSSTILVNIARIVIWTTGVSVMLSLCFGVDVNGIIAALGVGGIALSLGLQDTIKNFIGGLQVTIMGIVHPGDHIVVGGTEGIVHDVSWRQTTVVDYEHVVHLIPNSVINSTEVQKITPEFLVSSVVVLNNDGRNVDEMIREMELLAKNAVEKVAPLEKDPWLLVTQIGEYGVWAKMRFVLADVEYAREARDAALRAIAPYTRNNSSQILPDDED
ncbi:MAG: mechanosensitive ion channel [Eggerthellaceae bacterium]|nr:mechanosensitive ion channel [Eggerthellaceae bacterium]